MKTDKQIIIDEFQECELDPHEQLAMIADETLIQNETKEKIKLVTDRVSALFSLCIEDFKG